MPCSGGHPEWHIQGDVIPLLNENWDLIIAHPPCTYLTVAANRYYNVEKCGYKAIQRQKDREEAINIKDKKMFGHPTIKPLKIFETLIRNSSKENDLVLDCFSGSGTTAIACHNLKRRFICIEKDPEYWEESVKRLEDVRKQLCLF